MGKAFDKAFEATNGEAQWHPNEATVQFPFGDTFTTH